MSWIDRHGWGRHQGYKRCRIKKVDHLEAMLFNCSNYQPVPMSHDAAKSLSEKDRMNSTGYPKESLYYRIAKPPSRRDTPPLSPDPDVAMHERTVVIPYETYRGRRFKPPITHQSLSEHDEAPEHNGENEGGTICSTKAERQCLSSARVIRNAASRRRTSKSSVDCRAPGGLGR